MNPPSFHFAFVSNSLPVARTVRDYAASRHLAVDIRLASMEEALPVARALLAEGTDVILGGGGTGKLLRRHLRRPVVTIARSHLDILKALLTAREITRDIAFTTYGGVPTWPALFAELLGVRLVPVPFTTTQELVNGIRRAVDQGAGCVVGGGVCAEIAQARGCPGIVVTPGEEALERALDEALNIARSQRQDREQTAWLRGILESLHEGIVGLDRHGRKAASNRAAETLLDGISEAGGGLASALGLGEVLRSGRGKDGVVHRVNGRDLVINSLPVVVDGKTQGALAAFMPASRLRDMNRRLRAVTRQELVARHTLDSLVGASAAMRELRLRSARFAQSDAALHIHGESGTGKELLAHALHLSGPRRHGPFVAVNCGALPENLLESELFGYEEGAFTGARRGGKAGMFELAQDGTIFLDEIADISPAVQIRLLRVLETGEFFRLGADRPIAANARVLSSSWKDLVREVREGRFRADLYYRLTLLRLRTPPLRERPEDVVPLARHLLQRLGRPDLTLTPRAEHLLASYAWPGNVRELDALLRRYCLLCEPAAEPGVRGTESPVADGAGKTGIRPAACDEELLGQLLDDLRLTQGRLAPGPALRAATETDSPNLASDAAATGHAMPGVAAMNLRGRLERLERQIIEDELARCGHNRGLAARRLGISANTLWRKLKNTGA